jgi:hypothetical protein
MIQVGGVTYRVERVEPHHYAVYRLLDDAKLGTFRTLPALRLNPVGCEVDVFRDVVRVAMRSARTSAVMHAAPVFTPEEEPANEQRSPSTVPPRRAMA